MAGGPPAFPPEITSLSFFFDDFANSDEAASYVIEKNRGPGTFLLRPSTRSPGTLTLTISIDQTTARHVNVQMKPDDRNRMGVSFFIIPERSFSSFHDLYYYYSLNTICNMEMVSNVRLLNPLERPGAALPIAPPMVMPNEIPPLPSRSSVGSGLGAESVKSNQGFQEGRRVSGTAQAGLPVIPPISARRDRPSLDSQGNDNPTSSSSSGSGVGGATGAAAHFHEHQGPQYLAPGSPGCDDSMPRAQAQASPFVNSHDSLPRAQAQASPFVNSHDSLPRAQAKAPPFNSLPNPSPSLPVPMSKKERKEEQKRREKEEKKRNKDKKKKKEMNEMVQLGWCRPPMPIPQPAQEETPYYTTPRPYRNHLEDLKKMLRESEICDCGLRMMEAELAQGWTVHRSREDGSYKRVFYQHEDGNTTWAFPMNITDQLTDRQVKFIADLCRDAKQELPEAMFRRYQRIVPTSPGRGTFGSASSSRSRSSSTSSDQFGSNLSLSRSPPVVDPRSLPGATGMGN